MDFEYKGGNCVVITSKQATVVVDGKLSLLGLKDVQPKGAVEIATQEEFVVPGGRVTVDMPGEYEVENVSIKGVAAMRMIDHDDVRRTTMYRIVFPDITVGVIGHVASPLSDDQLEDLGMIDVLITPVGGGGYTLDASLAVDVVNKIGPKVVIPTHYADEKLAYEVPQDDLKPFLDELGAAHEATTKWKIKGSALPEAQTVVELTRTA
ncbi:MAG: MBL fold metallo-hydrolase [Acidobacteriota bacterium]|jgi:L-ascorbate metabolism protein UlaG (beta-lactamase superfamily)